MTRVAEVGRGIRGAIAASGAKHRRMRAGAAVFVVAAAVGVLGVASSEGATQRAAAGSTVTLAIFQEPDTLDPAAATLISSYQVLQSIFDPLMYQIGGKLYPGLATSMTVSKDSRTYTFMLRKGVTFQDGTPFNAQAVKFNFDRIVNPKYKAGTALGNLGPYQATKVVNPYKVQIIFKTPERVVRERGDDAAVRDLVTDGDSQVRRQLREPSGRNRPVHLQAVAEGAGCSGRQEPEVQLGPRGCREHRRRRRSRV